MVYTFLLILLFDYSYGQFSDGQFSEEAQECLALIQSNVCTQTVDQQLATGGHPLNDPMPIFQAMEILGKGDPKLISQWMWWKVAGNHDLCVKDPNSHLCTIVVRALPGSPGPTMGMCLPKECSAETYMEVFRCQARIANIVLNTNTSAIIEALQNFLETVNVSLPNIGPFSTLTQNISDLPKLATSAFQLIDYLKTSSTSYCSDQTSYKLSDGAIATIVLVSFIFFAITASTLINSFYRPIILQDKIRDQPKNQDSTALWFAKQLCAIESTKQLFEPTPKHEFDILNGIRVLSTGTIILGHTIMYWLIKCYNFVPAGVDYLSSFDATILYWTFYAVDSFFWLSGFLVAFFTLKKMNGKPATSLKIPCMAVFNRYLRLTPLYLFILILWMNLVPIISWGPHWYEFQTASEWEVCKKKWPQNIFYVSNLDPDNDLDDGFGCMGWTWYLSNDFQFFIISIFPLAYYFKKKYLVIGYFCFLTMLSIIVTASLSAHYETGILPVEPKQAKYVYTRPYSRVGVYAVGVLFGIYWCEQWRKQEKLKCDTESDSKDDSEIAVQQPNERNTLIKWLMLIISFSLFLIVLLVPYSIIKEGAFLSAFSGLKLENDWTQAGKNAWNALSRFMYAVSLTGIVYWLMTKRNLVWFYLSHKFWQPLGKLSYGMYLWHMIGIRVRASSTNNYTTFTRSEIVINYCCAVFLTIVVSYISYILVEQPCRKLSKGLMRWLQERQSNKEIGMEEKEKAMLPKVGETIR